ncbi:type II toxin-antitoxin system HicB family antitoxin [Bdellovibrionota bacterium FG-2]
MRYHVRVYKVKRGFWAKCIELEGCQTQADSPSELESNMSEALNVFLDEPASSRALFPFPRKRIRGRNIVGIEVRPRIAFSFYLRQLRLVRGLTQKEVAQQLGIKNLYSYQRLESSKTANPELATIIQLKRIFPEMSLDELLSA